MSEVNIDPGLFYKRLSIFQKQLSANNIPQALIIVGGRSDENTYKKSTVLQNWLLGYEFVHTAIYITLDKCIFITSEGKSKYLKHLTNQKPDMIELWIRTKDIDHNKQLFIKLLEIMNKNGNKYGKVLKDKYEGKFIDEWNEILNEKNHSLNIIDLALTISQSLAIKDSEEFNNTKIASNASVVMMDTFVNEMMIIVDDEKKITNSQLTDQIEDKIDNNKWYLQSKLGKNLLQSIKDFDPEYLEYCYSPIIQNGGDYDLKPSAISNDKLLIGEGVILSSIGLRYKSYCSNIARTFLIDPTKEMEKNYDFLLKLQKYIIDNLLKDGIFANKVYQNTIDYIKKERPDLIDHFTKNCGWLLGIEFRDSTFILNGKTINRKLTTGQIISLTIGFNDLSDFQGGNKINYALLLTDTIKITDDSSILLTNYSKDRPAISFSFNDSNDSNNNDSNNNNNNKNGNNNRPGISQPPTTKLEISNKENTTILKSKLRHENINADEANSEKLRQEIQSKLHEKRLKEGLTRFSKADATDGDDFKPIFKKYESYVRESQIPNSVNDLKIHIDYKNQTIILPISGRPIPFHINSYKNGSQNEEGDFTYLRLNFNSPGAGGNVTKKQELPYEDSPDNSFLRSITIRSKDRQRMIDVYKAIQDLKKDSVKREQEKKQMADVIIQPNLIELKGSRIKKLDNIFIRPTPDTKKLGGILQIHENGLRYYQSSFKNDQKVDILFSNIKHLFFQPCKDELIVLIHCHLKNPIMIGKRKTFDIQFYREASDMAFDETGGRKRKYRYGDEDELQQEQEERRRKALLDKEFKGFAELIADSSHGMVDLDIPFRELGFQGVPFRSSVLCVPTRDCLVQLIDPPYLVITLEEIEIAHLERVQFGLKNFDLVFVFKDFNKPVIHINTIPVELLEDVKSWLTDVDIPISEGQMNLNWVQIMKTVLADPYQFFIDGGWSFLTGEGESDEEEESDEESEFQASDEDPQDEDEESDDYASEESDDYSGSDDNDDDDDDSESGEDWDTLERKAAKADRNSGFD
ncbi:FACT (FAcilitates Chromatin Transcription) complex subunit, putative [Candida dubliniensis CD36]|uniref:FACT complex subunit n=1 Tax=Candida dubliniensis (strain CD36 / ATCC MYA-646 / CBS 7987 / NCPF 3949 / NRRL Y-17841) TaxID=573826 RepID=B9WGT9_CANDC|nr:FACT (FAcilitates Chromatin Transcription) complex subunit, putative [Candida dubliniensis CD36]CAX42465.1 FACT (FAcilitates Chromatin Transcription) complex subunit, putative [Candida dubliniensis CD36]